MKKLCVLIVTVITAGDPRFAAAQVDEDAVRLSGSARIAGTSRYRPGEWGSVALHLVNGSDEDQTPQAVSFFDKYEHAQFGTRMLVPAGSVRIVRHPVHIPADVGDDVHRLKLLTTLVEESGAGEIVQRQRYGDLFSSGLIPFTGVAPETVIVARTEPEDAHVYEALVAIRTDYGLDRRVGMLSEFPLPTNLLAYSGTEQLIIADDTLATDAAAAGTVRRWLLNGGHLWVFLDLVGQQTLERLLGNECRVEHVDHVTHTDVTIVSTNKRGNAADSHQYEQPVAMARVLVEDLDVTHTVNGWPAAFGQSFGRGYVQFTTLAARGWIRPRGPGDPQPIDATRGSYYVPLESFRNAADAFMQAAPAPPLSVDQFKPYLQDRIGYQIVERRPVIAVLSVFCVGLLIGGVWLHRRGRLERFLWIVPSASALAVAVLGLMGMQARQDMRDTLSVLQLIDLSVEQDEVQIAGAAALYRQDKGEAALAGTSTGILEPERFVGEGGLRRLVWTSGDRWTWQNLPLDAGLRFATFEAGATIDEPPELTGSFGSDGFVGTLNTGSLQSLSDVVIATPTQHTLAPAFDEAGRLVGGRAEVQEPGHVIADALLTDEQRRRQDLVRQMLATEYRRQKYPDRPTLIAWTDPLDAGFEAADHVDRAGAALLTIPIRWERPEPQTSVTIPSPFVPYESVASDGVGVTTAFDRHSGLWRKSGPGKRALLRFQVPEIVLPLQVETATLTVDVSAASRIVSVSMGRPEQPVLVSRLESPLGVQTVTVDDPHVLHLDEAGGLHVLIDVGPVTFKQGEDANVTHEQESWLIHSLQLELTGRTESNETNL